MTRYYTCVILCGGKSQRMRFELPNVNKSIAIVNNVPILHHILNYYSTFGFIQQFILCMGGDSDSIRTSVTTSENFRNGQWNDREIILLDTGENTTATGRIFQAIPHIHEDDFFVTYADIISNVDLGAVIQQHISKRSEITMVLVKAQMPYGKVMINEDSQVNEFIEKPVLDDWINAGYFVIHKRSFHAEDIFLEFEQEFLPKFIQRKGIIYGYKHFDFWKGIDTYKDLLQLRSEWLNIQSILSE